KEEVQKISRVYGSQYEVEISRLKRECNINCVSKECVRFLTHTVFYLIE
ncbi:hypothetical protein P8819_21125, partial [Bacillus velezensis]